MTEHATGLERFRYRIGPHSWQVGLQGLRLFAVKMPANWRDDPVSRTLGADVPAERKRAAEALLRAIVPVDGPRLDAIDIRRFCRLAEMLEAAP